MYKKILDYVKEKPSVYLPNTIPFWDDEHISQHMLDAHLNPEFEGASRRHSFIRQSVQWISGLCRDTNNKELLDLGCGPGIYAELFHESGFRVTGIDFSKRSINYAEQNAKKFHKKITYYYQNYLHICYENQFDVVTLIYCDFGVLNPKDRYELLCKIRHALKPGGLLILDGFTEAQLAVWRENETIQYYHSGFWSPMPYACLQRNMYYQVPKVFLEQYVIITEDECKCYNMWNQIFCKDALLEELKQAGFCQAEFFDDVCGNPFTGTANTICVVAS